jgi:integrase
MKGGGRVFQRTGSPFWWVSYYHHRKEQREVAKRVRTGEKLEATDKNRHEAERWLKHRLGEIAAEQHGGPAFVGARSERVTVAELLDSLGADYRTRGKWNPKVASNVKPVREYFGTWRAVDITRDTVTAYIVELKDEGYSNATINRRTQLLGQAFNLAHEDKKVTEVPKIPHLSEVNNVRQGFFEHAEDVISRLPEYLQDFARFGYLTGWRKGSIQSLRWDDVDDDVIYVRAENVKTRKADTMPLEGELRDIISRRRAAAVLHDDNGNARFAEYVFHHNGEPIGDFRKAWATACCAAGVGKKVCADCGGDVQPLSEPSNLLRCPQCEKNWSRENLRYTGRLFYDFRRTAARDMIRAGTPQVVAMKITGHHTGAMFQRYAIVNEDQKRQALAQVQQFRAERKVAVRKGGQV